MMDEELRQTMVEVREMKKMCGNINVKLTNIVTQRGQDWKKKLEAEYQRGLDDAWECGKKLAWTAKYGGYGERLNDVFGRDDTFDFYDYTPNEAIEKLKAFEQKQDKIKVGDEVAFHHDDGRPDTVVVVTYIGQDGFIDGMDGRGTQYAHKNPIKWTKTGRHFAIASILEDLRK